MHYLRTLACTAALLLLCSYSFAQNCSQAMVRGTWGWQSHGTAMMSLPGSPTPVPVPYASLGVIKVDNQGRYTAHGTISAGGQVQDIELTGSIQVNADCTATDTYSFGPLTFADQFVILSANEMQLIPTKHPLGPVTGVAEYRRIAWGEPHCTSQMVRGVYGGSAEGTYMIPVPGFPQPVPTPFSGVFNMRFQRSGIGNGKATASMGGNIINMQFPTMSIEVTPDCTATMSYDNAISEQFPGQTFSGKIKYIVLNYGDELIGMETESSVGLPIELENHKQISRFPAFPDR